MVWYLFPPNTSIFNLWSLLDLISDEIEDGLAASAKAQAKIWAEAAKEAGEGVGLDKEFIAELVRMGEESASATAFRNRNLNHHDAIGAQNGVFSSARRLQPRYQANEKAKKYDELVENRTRAEMTKRKEMAEKSERSRKELEERERQMRIQYERT